MPANTKMPTPDDVRMMFDAIAHSYDRLNHILSFGLDIRWRGKAINMLTEKRGGIILDIAAGSGDFSLDALEIDPRLIVATDFAMEMLNVFHRKLQRRIFSSPIRIASCDAHALPFRDCAFDATMVAFGIRNFADRQQTLSEMYRVLKPGGLSLVLELSEPRKPIVSQIYKVYSRILLPLIGRVVSRHNSAYRYLPESIGAFPPTDEFLSLMSMAGFGDLRASSLSFGIATIFVGRKP